MNEKIWDVGIVGGGLAGLSLAIHLKRKRPSASIVVLERKQLPYPEATHKVGESTVELAAHYFSEVLGLKEHLQSAQLRKLGLRLFFTAQDGSSNNRIENRVSMGSDRHLSVPTYQIDRGRFENFLVDEARGLGVEIIASTKVTDISLSETDSPHVISFALDDKKHSRQVRWTIDASGRAGHLKRKLQLEEESPHDSNAVWFRVKGRIDLDDWCDDPAWRKGHDGMHSRWYSTNHLTGYGYWVWLIPLASGYTSIGIVTDPKIHPLSRFRSVEETFSWLREFEPQCARELESRANDIADYLAIKHYAHKCSRVISGDRWAMTGDAGVFIDPLYSPGSDFIAIQNTFITDVILRDLTSERFVGRCEVYNDLYRQLTESFLATFRGQYPVFGNPRVMPLKVVWDYTIYWGFLAFVAVQGKFCDLQALSLIKESVERVYAQGEALQALFRTANTQRHPPARVGFIDIAHVPFLVELNRRLSLSYSEDSFLTTLHENLNLIDAVYTEIREILSNPTPAWNTAEELIALLNGMPPTLATAA